MILSCNPYEVNRFIVSGKCPEIYLNQNHKQIFDSFQKYNFSMDQFMFDRTSSIKHYLNVDNVCKIPTYKTTKSFLEIADARAKQLLSLGKPIYVSWSGGIDSTFVLLSLYENAADKSQITVYGTYNSILESGSLFDTFIKPNLQYDIHTNYVDCSLNYSGTGNNIFVTGNIGNQLFYPSTKHSKYRDSILEFKTPYVGCIDHYANLDYQSVLTEGCVEFLSPAIAKSPKKITTLQDLRWFVIFNFTYNSVLFNQHQEVKNEHSRIISFFNTDDFQSWSFSNNDVPTKTGDWKDERWQMREYISEVLVDDFYSKNKQKSTSVLSKRSKNWLFLLNDYSNIYLQDL